MKVRGITYALTLLLLLANSSSAVFDSLARFPKPDNFQSFQMLQGWWNDKLVWYILTETNNIRFAQSYGFPDTPYEDGLTLDYKLSSAQEVDGLARAMGIVINPWRPQGPIFQNAPAPTDTPDYSGLWAVYWIKWRPGATKVPLTSWADVLARLGTELDYSNVYGGTAIDPDVPFTIVDAPVLAVGKLGGPWWPAPSGDPDNYRIKQGRVDWDYAYTKKIDLPTWFIYATECISNRVRIVQSIIPDIFEPGVTGNPPPPGSLADRLGTTWAPRLKDMPVADTQIFYEFFPGVDAAPERPPYQFPVIRYYPCANCWAFDVNPFSWRNLNTEYSAVMRQFVLFKELTGDPVIDEGFLKAVINNVRYIDDLLYLDQLSSVETGVFLNAPVVPPVLDPPQPWPQPAMLDNFGTGGG